MLDILSRLGALGMAVLCLLVAGALAISDRDR